MLPSLYISHGSPALMVMENITTKFLKQLSSTFEKPKYILVISAHWVTKNLKILYKENPELIYDFYNFPKELYEITYPAKSDKNKNDEIITLLEENGFSIEKESLRDGFDHGVWSPLSFLYPNADIPILQLSLPLSYSPKRLFELGNVLKKLKNDTLIIASGALTHNIFASSWNSEDSLIAPYAKEFRDWIIEKTENAEINSLLNFKTEAPKLSENHPSLEHFLPIFVAMGASDNYVGKSLHNIFMYNNQSMETIIFKG